MIQRSIAFIGGGNMARSIIGGLIAGGWPQDKFWVADPDPAQRQLLLAQHPALHATEDNAQAAKKAAILLMAVKPQVLQSVAQALSATVQAYKPLIVSIAAGIRVADLERWLGGELAVVRCMPNTPALVQAAATGLYANKHVTCEQRTIAEAILGAVGITVWVEDERQLDAVTALSGSGPAYFLLVMEAMERSGIELGLTPEIARRLTLQTAFGTAKLALDSRDDAATLRARVTSKGGTTERAIAELESGELRRLFACALAAAAHRAQELADQFAERSS
jgi:pyrroline-5-carboxylate reductase